MKDRIFNIGIQGFPGAFHEEAALLYFKDTNIKIKAFERFEELGNALKSNQIDKALMAIENSIAGTILQNYKIIRECKLWISGEQYLPIRLQLLALQRTSLTQIEEVHSHPMALNQSLSFLNKYPHIKKVESIDTALSAKLITDNEISNRAAIASSAAAKLYHLNVLASNIETNRLNYTRFFILEKEKQNYNVLRVDKASVCVTIQGRKGSLLALLQRIQHWGINLSKLQSFPVMGKLRSYYFHIDLEFENFSQYKGLCQDFSQMEVGFIEMGVYEKMGIAELFSNPLQKNNP